MDKGEATKINRKTINRRKTQMAARIRQTGTEDQDRKMNTAKT